MPADKLRDEQARILLRSLDHPEVKFDSIGFIFGM